VGENSLLDAQGIRGRSGGMNSNVWYDLQLPERRMVLEWMLSEWDYSNKKFNLVDIPAEQRDDHDASMREHGFSDEDSEAFWWRQVTQYFVRAKLFGVDTPQGKQALLKSLMTLFDCCACMIRVHGIPPEPGHSSGEIHDWAVHPGTYS
jgi:hypothetical protein